MVVEVRREKKRSVREKGGVLLEAKERQREKIEKKKEDKNRNK